MPIHKLVLTKPAASPRFGETAHSLEEPVASVDGEKEQLTKTREGRVTLLGTEEREQFIQREFRLRPEVSEAVHCREKEDNERKPQSQIQRSGDRETLEAHLRVLCGCTIWGMAGEKSGMVACARAWKALGCRIKECGIENNRV